MKINEITKTNLVEARVRYEGLVLDYSIDGANVDVRAIIDGKQVAYVVFLRDGKLLIPDDLAVDEEYRGRGIAKKMYDWVKSLPQRFEIIRGDQTAMGKRFWDKNRGEHVDVWEEGVADVQITEASKDFAERHYAATEIEKILDNLVSSESPNVTPEIIRKIKELVAITGRGHTVPGFGSAGPLLDKLIDMYRQSQIRSGQMPEFTGRATTARDMARQIANQTRGTYRYFEPQSWTTRYGQRYRDPADYVVYPDQESYDDALEWIESKGKKVRYREHFGYLNTATQIGRYIVEPSTFTQDAFSDEPRTTHRISVRLAKTINQGGRQQVDITDQQVAALHDIAATRDANAMATVQSIIAVLKGMEDIKSVIANSKKIDPRDKAKLDAIITGAKNFQEPHQGVAEDTVDEMALASYKTLGDFSKPGPFRGVDWRLVPHPKSELKAAKFFEQTPFDFRLFFANKPGLSRYREYGPMTPDQIVKVFGEEDAKTILDNHDDAITVVYISNAGAEKVMMTPWIMAHRFGHAIYAGAMKDKWSAWKETEKLFFSTVNRLLDEYYGKVGSVFDFRKAEQPNYNLTPEYNALFNAIGTQRSSRTRQIRRPYEFMYELFAQYLGTGTITLNPLPTNLGYGRKVFGNPSKYLNIKREFRDESERRQISEMLARDMELMFNDVLGNSVGQVYIM